MIGLLWLIPALPFVGFLIHLYSAEFMAGGEGYSRFFAYMNLFTGSTLTLVLADNLLLLFLGWEAVGLCSYPPLPSPRTALAFRGRPAGEIGGVRGAASSLRVGPRRTP